MLDQRRKAFSNYNTVRMREAIRYLTAEKFKLFLKIPFLLHINARGYPGFVETFSTAHGIYNFNKSGFYKTALSQQIFPKSIQEYIKVQKPMISAIYHIGSLGTFTQGPGSDFDYWVMVDKKQYNPEKHAALKKKLDGIVKYSREKYDQQVTFFIMDTHITADAAKRSETQDDMIAIPRIFLQEEFYRTYLMIAGKIPLWSLLPESFSDKYEQQRFTTQALSTHRDIIDIGPVGTIPFTDILKGLLWHICKSAEDPIKALIKSTLVFSYGFGLKEHKTLLCDKIRKGYADVGIDDYSVDPYKAVFDRILKFHECCEPDDLPLIKNAVFFRLCGYPNIKLPEKGSPKHQLLTHYIRSWKLKPNQISKLLAYTTWSESEKLLLEKTVIRRLAKMFNLAMQKAKQPERLFRTQDDRATWNILKNKTRMRLHQKDNKINSCSTFLKKQTMVRMLIEQSATSWRLLVASKDKTPRVKILVHNEFAHVFGWILENGLYRRHTAQLKGRTIYKIFDTQYRTVSFDALYVSASPVKPMSDNFFLSPPLYQKQLVFLFFNENKNRQHFFYAELLSINSWGEIFTDAIRFEPQLALPEKLNLLVKKMSQRADIGVRLFIYQFSTAYVPDIDYELKKKFEDVTRINTLSHQNPHKPYLDRI